MVRTGVSMGQTGTEVQQESPSPEVILYLLMFVSHGFSLPVFLTGSENGRCVASEYFTEPDVEITTENTANILSE